MADTLANLIVSLGLRVEKDMNVPMFNRWGVAPLDEEFEEDVDTVNAQDVNEEDWVEPCVDYL